MTAEERLDAHRHAMTVWSFEKPSELSPDQRVTVDACEAYDIAREAIALLRDYEMFDVEHVLGCEIVTKQSWSPGDPVPTCNCGVHALIRKASKFLDGGG